MFNATDPSPEYELDWPRELFTAEARTLLDDLSNPRWIDDAELLLEEAFIGKAPKDDLRTAKWHDLPPELFKYPPGASDAEVARAFLTHLVSSADNLPDRSERRPYWSARRAVDAASTQPAAPERTVQLQQHWVRLVEDLQKRGYLDCVAPQGCVAEASSSPAAEVLAAKLTGSLQMDVLWPLHYEDWDSDAFYGLVEAVHDLVARPRHRDQHALDGCCGHYSNFARIPAQVLYRYQVDQLLARFGVDLHLAAGGEDVGRLVRTSGGGREGLVLRALGSRDPGVRDDVGHAIALFRSRAATTSERRSAVVTLAGILERRRALLRTELFKKDESALFRIANEFDVRHRDKSQQGDYDPVFLDWLFWWYLATVELTDRLLARQDGTA